MSEYTWKELERECNKCTKCGLNKCRTNVVIGEGNNVAKVMFIGEAPGEKEDKTGLPFQGTAGTRLNNIFKDLGIDRKDIYIANIVKCRPPNNRNPKMNEIESCIGYLEKQIKLINPKVIVLLGLIPLKVMLDKDTVKANRGRVTEKEGIKYIPTYHPRAYIKSEIIKEDVQKAIDIAKKH